MMRHSAAPVSCLDVAPSIHSKLHDAGFRTVGDLEGCGAIDLSKEAGISAKDALLVLKVAFGADLGSDATKGALLASQLQVQEDQARSIVTFSPQLDAMLGGGIATRQITEICGVPGVGKTQLGLQVLVDVQIPLSFGGLQGQALHIDTEGSLMPERLRDVADACARHIHTLAAASPDPHAKQEATPFTVDSILQGIHYIRAYDAEEQVAVVYKLKAWLEAHPAVRLVVFDSWAFLFRQQTEDMAHRTRLLSSMAAELMQAAEAFNVAVVLMNQVTTKLGAQNDTSKLVPALGDSWSHAATNRLILYWDGPQRFAHLQKSPSRPATTAPFFVTSEGIRECPAPGHQRQGGSSSGAGAAPPTSSENRPCVLSQKIQQHGGAAMGSGGGGGPAKSARAVPEDEPAQKNRRLMT